VNAASGPAGADEATVVVRMGFRFSGRGTHLACLAADGAHRWQVELWALGAGGPRRVLRRAHPGEAAYSTVLPLRGGRLLLSRHRRGVQLLELLDAGGEVTAAASWTGRPLRLLVGGGGSAFAVGAGENGRTALYRFPEGGAAPKAVAGVLGRLSGGLASGRRLLFTRALGGRCVPVALDPDAGTVTALPLPGTTGSARLLATGGRSLLLALGDGPHPRMALADIDGAAPVRPLAEDSPLAALPGTVHPVALDRAGRRAALVGVRGARSALVLHDWALDRVQEVALPAGVLSPVAAWGAHGLWLPLATPRHPAVPCWLPRDEAGEQAATVRTAPLPRATPRPGGTAEDAAVAGDRRGGEAPLPRMRLPEPLPGAGAAHSARLEQLPGAVGPVEAVVYGPPWERAERVVVALHGGPNSRWTMGYEPLFQALAAAGVAVVAPNQRGSTGYGAAFTLAAAGDWGGPDLDDVLAVAAHLRAGRQGGAAPAVFGISYGAWLAVLSATAEPGAWSRCAAVAPFLSGARLHADGGPAVRHMVERLGGDSPRSASRDLQALATRLAVPLLLVHGRHDETVPVAHSRLLAAAVRAGGPGRPRQTDRVRYLELGRGHSALGLSAADPVFAEVVGFLRAAPVPPPQTSAPPPAVPLGAGGGGTGTAVQQGRRASDVPR
jgi:alpha-beta hydrolase superfamily lysophospholipase